MSDNLIIYDKVRSVPKTAQRTITGGRLNGKTDINPMWRIKMLTEQFGPCGFGWKYVITKQWLEEGNGGEIAAFCNIDLFVNFCGEWSEAIPGTGGSAFIAKEKSGLYTTDECFKMALTDAISVACKALGFGADIYWDADRTKYDAKPEQKTRKSKDTEPAPEPEAPKEAPKKSVDPQLLPGGERFQKAVEQHALGQQAGARAMREVWINITHATPEQIKAFDEAVFKYKVDNNIV